MLLELRDFSGGARVRSRAGASLFAAATLLTLLTLVTSLTSACGGESNPAAERPPKLYMAAAANLSRAFPALAESFRRSSGIEVVFSFGSTAFLAHQIENGAPFDLYAAADVEHVDRLVESGDLLGDSRTIYAQGRLVLWVPPSREALITEVADLTRDAVRFVAVARPQAAPYGRASVEALRSLGLWDEVEPKIVYAQNVSMARQFAESGNADAAFVAPAVLGESGGRRIPIPAAAHQPILQAMGIVSRSPSLIEARRFADFVVSEQGRRLLADYGYLPVGAAAAAAPEGRSEGPARGE